MIIVKNDIEMLVGKKYYWEMDLKCNTVSITLDKDWDPLIVRWYRDSNDVLFYNLAMDEGRKIHFNLGCKTLDEAEELADRFLEGNGGYNVLPFYIKTT